MLYYIRLIRNLFICLTGLFALFGCDTGVPENIHETTDIISLKPDYTALTIPANIAPLNFKINMPIKNSIALFKGANGFSFTVRSSDSKIIIPEKKWKKLLSENKETSYSVEIIICDKNGQWIKYPAITNYISGDLIDEYLVYRLIEPGYAYWNKMGIYQRNLESFNEKPIMLNSMSDNNCMNCHSFCNYNSNHMALHMRGENAGTYISSGKNGIERINTQTDAMISAGVYPSWSADGKKIAFSTNKTIQFFHAVPDKRIEVTDLESDIVIYDVESNQMDMPPALNRKENLETFPFWSPDGEYLYFCSAETKPLIQYDSIRYSLMRIKYNKSNESFGSIDTLIDATNSGKSVSFPAVSPNNQFLIFCLSAYGNFSIWHQESNLYLLNLKDHSFREMELNSDQAESYHFWSSNNKWIVFSSKRDDGQYTHPYFSYIDDNGNSTKPFLLPQKSPEFYDTFLKAYNVPVFVKEESPYNPHDFKKIELKHAHR